MISLSSSSDATMGGASMVTGISSPIGEPPGVAAWVFEEEAITGKKGREKEEKREGKGRKKRMERKEKDYRELFCVFSELGEENNGGEIEEHTSELQSRP